MRAYSVLGPTYVGQPGARFCFRGSRAMPLCGVSRWRMRCLWYAVASLSCHPCSIAVSLAAMSAGLAHQSWTMSKRRRVPPHQVELRLRHHAPWIFPCLGISLAQLLADEEYQAPSTSPPLHGPLSDGQTCTPCNLTT